MNTDGPKPLPSGWQDCGEKFWSKVNNRISPDACWLWQENVFDFGHGQFYFAKRLLRAHRVAWALAHNQDPHPHFVLHTCDVPACCNPQHLFLGSKEDNSADMVKKGRGGRPKGSVNRHTLAGATHCIRGHEFTPENTYVQPKTGYRQCRTCNRNRRNELARSLHAARRNG